MPYLILGKNQTNYIHITSYFMSTFTYAAILADKNNEAEWEPSPCSTCVWNKFEEEDEKENVGTVLAAEKKKNKTKQTCDDVEMRSLTDC